MCVFVYVLHTYIQMCVYVCVCVLGALMVAYDLCVSVCTCMCESVCTYIHVYTNVYILGTLMVAYNPFEIKAWKFPSQVAEDLTHPGSVCC